MNKDPDGFCDIWAEDAVQEILLPPEFEGFESVWSGKQSITSYYKNAIARRKDWTFYIHEIHQTLNPDVLIVEASAHSVVIESRRTYDQHYINLFKLRDGKLILLREHVNPLKFMRAFGPN
jgi:ketosteroid isomerase-like protein